MNSLDYIFIRRLGLSLIPQHVEIYVGYTYRVQSNRRSYVPFIMSHLKHSSEMPGLLTGPKSHQLSMVIIRNCI